MPNLFATMAARAKKHAKTSALLLLVFSVTALCASFVFDRLGGAKSSASRGAPAVSLPCGDGAIPAALKGLNTGELAGLALLPNPVPLPELAFQSADGASHTLVESQKRLILLNLWATWCAPCRAELPTLDALEAALGSENFTVLALNIDTARLEQRALFWREAGITHLAFYADSSAKSYQSVRRILPTEGLPTTLLLDGRVNGQACVVAYLPGPANWDSIEAKALIEAALAKM